MTTSSVAPSRPQVGIVGPCAAGKTTLVAGLRQHGFTVRHIAQEHSYVKDMWLRLVHPDVLIYIDVSYPVTLARRRIDWNEAEYRIQIDRLAHARQHADLYLLTDDLSPQAVLAQVLEFLSQTGLYP